MGYLLSLRRPTLLTCSNLTSYAMTYQDHCQPIKTNTSKSAKNYDIGLKISEYDDMGCLKSLRRPTLTWSSLTSFVLTYHDHGYPIKRNTYK